MPHHARQRPRPLHQKPILDPNVFGRLNPPSPAFTNTLVHLQSRRPGLSLASAGTPLQSPGHARNDRPDSDNHLEGPPTPQPIRSPAWAPAPYNYVRGSTGPLP
ncbi:hypothetical protein IMZ48_43405 [Candidatus Bathyarchaeota archaeon]|nr:hypothetical protein [Candidatus Bathyarchaeota archaeon]